VTKSRKKSEADVDERGCYMQSGQGLGARYPAHSLLLDSAQLRKLQWECHPAASLLIRKLQLSLQRNTLPESQSVKYQVA
jgi:hypothetical protein